MIAPSLSQDDLASVALLSEVLTASPDVQLRTLCRVLKRVIVENFNYCNRKCSFCTNSVIDRESRFLEMPDATFSRIFEQLSTGGYEGTVFVGRFSEPLAHEMVYERLQRIRAYLPKTRISLNTNGDFLAMRDLHRLAECGLNEMKIMCYLPKGVEFTSANAITHCKRFLDRHQMEATIDPSSSESEVIYKIRTESDLAISLHAENYSVVGLGSDRGGVIPELSGARRILPCFAPFFELNVDYSGDVAPCCNMNSDVPQHRLCVLGNVNTQSLIEVFFGAFAVMFRRACASPQPDHQPCRHCHYYWPNRVLPGHRVSLSET